jgi:excinuclease UvrABC ATPase subunit
MGRGPAEDLPRDRVVVIAGLSGSRNSSLAVDVVYAERPRFVRRRSRDRGPG